MEQVLGRDDGKAGTDQQRAERPKGDDLAGHAPASLGLSADSFLGGCCMSRSRLPVAHEGACCRPMACNRSLSSNISRRSLVAMSNDFIMMMASVGHTWTHNSQNSQA